MLVGYTWRMRSLKWRCRDLEERGWRSFSCSDTDPFPARCQNREGHPLLAIHTSAFVRFLIMPVACVAICYWGSNDLNRLRQRGVPRPRAPARDEDCGAHSDKGDAATAAVSGQVSFIGIVWEMLMRHMLPGPCTLAP